MKNFTPKTRQEKLAQEIAQGLGEEEYLAIYHSFARRYPEELLLQAYEQTLKVPAEKLRKSRRAIFNYLVNKYVRQNKHNAQNPGY